MLWIRLAAVTALLLLPGLAAAGPPSLNPMGMCCGWSSDCGCCATGIATGCTSCESACNVFPGCCEVRRPCCVHAWDGFCREKCRRHCCGAAPAYCEPQWCGVVRPRHCCGPMMMGEYGGCGCDGSVVSPSNGGYSTESAAPAPAPPRSAPVPVVPPAPQPTTPRATWRSSSAYAR